MTKKTGGLHLRRDAAHGVVWFTTGAITGGAGDVNRQSLARRLVGAGLVSDQALADAVERAQNEAVGVALALQQAGAVDDGALHDLASEHIVDAVFDLLRWADGDFAFVVDEPNVDDVGVSRQVDEVVTEARRRLELWADVATAIPSPQAVLTIAPAPDDEPQVTREDWTLLALVDGRRTVGEIVALCGRGDYAVVSALADLLGRGLLRIEDGEGFATTLRRFELLAPLESGPAPVRAPEPAAADVVAEAPGADVLQPAAPAATPDATPSQPAAVTQLTPAARTEVTPRRPEPFVRQPEHPEEPLPVAVAAAVGAAATPAAATLIERDPSVNKSLLLRLIAGVRGL
jgi:hypothetical protein